MKEGNPDTGPVHGGYRTEGPLQRGEPVTILLDGETVRAYAGETVMAAIMANGRVCFRRTDRRDEPRGPYCGIGICFDCAMTIDGRAGVRTCQTPVSDGMRVETPRRAMKPPEPQ